MDAPVPTIDSPVNLPAEALRSLCCPRCPDGALVAAGPALVCARCVRRYPFVGGVPCLVDEPALWRLTWRTRLDDYNGAVGPRLRALGAEAQSPDLLPLTRARVQRVAAGLAAQQQHVQALLADLTAGGEPLAGAGVQRPDARDQLLVLECYENVFRDWVWGQREGELMRAIVVDLFPEKPGTLAVYGAGAGRLAADVHRTLAPGATFAFDINPLPLLIAARLLRGEELELVEFPVAPHAAENVVVNHHVRAAAELLPGRGLTWLLADAYRPPFAPGSLDAVLTSWFIDAPPVDLRVTAAAINRVLRPGGVWINCGPLRFRDDLSRTYVIEEVHEIIAAASFELGTRGRHDVPYFDSPASGARRIETVFTFAARKTGETTAPVPVPPPAAGLAPWVADPHLPVPMSPALLALHRSSVFTAGVISRFDGQRSLADVATELAASWSAPPAAVLDQLRALFVKVAG